MKTSMVAMILAAALMAALPVYAAEEVETELKLKTDRLWNLAALPVYFLTETFLHEFSHVAVAKAMGADVSGFKPYPHYTADGDFLMGGFDLEGNDLTARQQALIAIAPYLTDAMLFVMSDLLLTYRAVEPKSVGGLVLYSAGMIAPFVDFVYNANGMGAYNDFVRYSSLMNVNRYALMVFADGLAVFAACRLVARGIDVFFDRVPAQPQKSSQLSFAPILGASFTGFGASFRF